MRTENRNLGSFASTLARDLRLQLALAVGLPALLLLCLPALPITDMPEHTLAIAGLRDALFGGTQAPPVSLVHNLGTSPYLAYHLTGAVLAKLCGSAELANRALLFSVAVGFPLALRRTLLAFQASPTIAWFGVLPFYSRALSIGFLPYLSSVPLGLLLLAAAPVDRVDENAHDAASASANHATRDVQGVWVSPLRRGVTMGVLASALFYSHISSFSIFVPAALLVPALTRLGSVGPLRGKLIQVVRDSAWVLPAVLLAFRFLLAGRISMRADEGLAQAEVGTMRFARGLHAFPLWLFDNFRANGDDLVAVGYWVLFLTALVGSYRAVYGGSARLRLTHAVPAAVALAVYLLTPFQVGAAAFLNVRLAPILLLLTLPMLRAPLPLWLQRSVATVSFAGGLTFYAYARGVYDASGASLMSVIEAIPANSRVATLNFDDHSQAAYVDPFVYAGSIAVARKGGVAGFSFASLPHWSVHYRAENKPPEHDSFWVFEPCSFRNQRDGEFYDHVIVRGDLNPFAGKPPGPVFDVAYEGGNYRLYRKRGTERWASVPGAKVDEGPCSESSSRPKPDDAR
jgi:hypothetical protein